MTKERDLDAAKRRLGEALKSDREMSESVAVFLELDDARVQYRSVESDLRSAQSRLQMAECALAGAVDRLDRAEQASIAHVREERAKRVGDKTGVLSHIGGRAA